MGLRDLINRYDKEEKIRMDNGTNFITKLEYLK